MEENRNEVIEELTVLAEQEREDSAEESRGEKSSAVGTIIKVGGAIVLAVGCGVAFMKSRKKNKKAKGEPTGSDENGCQDEPGEDIVEEVPEESEK